MPAVEIAHGRAAHAQQPGRNTGIDSVRFEAPAHHRPGGDHAPIADVGAVQDARARADPDIVADPDALFRQRLFGDGPRIQRNAVIGRAGRLRLPERQEGRPRKGKRAKVRRKSPFHFGLVDAGPGLSFTPRAAQVEPLMIAFADLTENQCRFAYGEEAPYFFCGHPQQADSSYCPAHKALCSHPAPQPTPRAERRAA